MGRALVGPPGSLWAGPFRATLGPCGPGPCWPPWALMGQVDYIYIYRYSVYGIPMPLVHLSEHRVNCSWPCIYICMYLYYICECTPGEGPES